ncbi:putative ribonuclease H-like domain-containing protein [Tanacetum coccineum]
MNAARPMSYLSKTTHSTVKRHIYKNTTFKKSNFNQRVNAVRPKAVVNAAMPKAVLNAVKETRSKSGTCPILLTLKKLMDGMLPLEVTPKKGKSQAEVQSKQLTDESHVLLKVPRKNNMYSVDLKNIVPKGGLTCLFAKVTSDESKLWHRRLGHINFKTMNKLVKGNLVRGLPSKLFENNQTCVACQKGKQHRASYDYSRFGHVFFLATKDETSGILKSFITRVENLIDQRVKRKNRALIEAARTMIADSKLPTTFWAEAVNTACYVQNRVLVTKPHNKTSYELSLGRKPALGFMRPFGCLVTILNTIDHLGKFDSKADEGLFLGYSINRSGPNWLFDIDVLTKSMNYKPIVTGNKSNGNASTKACDDAGKANMETSSPNDGSIPSSDDGKKVDENPREFDDQEKDASVNSTNNVNAASTNKVNAVGRKASIEFPDDPNMLALEDIVYLDDDEDVGAKADMNNLDAFMPVSPIPTTRVHKDHPIEQIIGDLNSSLQTRRMINNLEEHVITWSWNSRDCFDIEFLSHVLGLYLCCRFNFGRTSLTGFPAQSVRSSNAYALDSPYLLVLNIRTSQSRQHHMSESDSYYLSD